MRRLNILGALTFLLWLSCMAASAEIHSQYAVRLETESEIRIVGEVAPISVEITNIGTEDAPQWDRIAPGALEEFRYRMVDAKGKELELWNLLDPAIQILDKPLRPGEKAVYNNVLIPRFFFYLNLGGYFPSAGEYSVWIEYVPEIRERPDAPIVAKSNVLKFHIEPLNIIAEKKIESEYLDLGSDPVTKYKGYFKAFVHKGEKSNRLYYTDNELAPFQINSNVVPEKFDMAVDRYGNAQIWYHTNNGDWYHFTKWHIAPPDPDRPLVKPPVHGPNPPINYDARKYVWQKIDVPAGHKPQFKVTEGKVTLEFIPVSQPPEGKENHQPQDGGEGRHNGAGPGVSGETPPAASSFPIHLLIIAAVIIIGAFAAFLIIRSQKRHGT